MPSKAVGDLRILIDLWRLHDFDTNIKKHTDLFPYASTKIHQEMFDN